MNSSLSWIERLVGSLEDKKRYRDYRARVRRLPADYRSTAEPLERYLTRVGATSDGAALLSLLTDLVETLEAGANAGAAATVVVGPDPVSFADDLLRRHARGGWIDGWTGNERARLTDAVRAASLGGAR